VATLGRAMEMVRIGGSILAYGTVSETAANLPFYELYYKEISIMGARSARPEDFTDAVEAVASGRVALEPLLSARFPIGGVEEALRASSVAGTLKVLVDV
jgi:threonine dehydrogenase-like Zn-dependent dehydrogenase